MNPRLLIENLEDLAELDGGVDGVRQLILQFAIEGKLSRRSPSDEDVAGLLTTIRRQREELIAKREIRRIAALDKHEVDPPPFEIPASWTWALLGNVALKITDGTHHSPPNSGTGEFKYITAKNIRQHGVDLSNLTYVTQEIHDEIFARCNPEKGDLLYVKDGATTGRVTINQLEEPFSMLSSVALIKPPPQVSNRFLLHVLRSQFFLNSIRDKMTGVAITRTTLKRLNLAPIPVPPAEEQERIAVQVDDLMALCDELEHKKHQRETTQHHLVKASYNALTTASTPEETHESWQRIAQNFTVMTASPANTTDLRELVLQLGMSGELTESHPSDEPVQQLAKRLAHGSNIRAKGEKTADPPCRKGAQIDASPCEIPEHWLWLRLKDVITVHRGVTYKRAQARTDSLDGHVALLRGHNINATLNYDDVVYVPRSIVKPHQLIQENDVLITMSSGSVSLVGKAAQAKADLDATFGAFCGLLRPSHHMDPAFLGWYFQSPIYRSAVSSTSQGSVGINNLSKRKLEHLLIPVPPVQEQRRIAVHIQKLAQRIEALEHLLARRLTTQQALLDSLMAGVSGN